MKLDSNIVNWNLFVREFFAKFSECSKSRKFNGYRVIVLEIIVMMNLCKYVLIGKKIFHQVCWRFRKYLSAQHNSTLWYISFLSHFTAILL